MLMNNVGTKRKCELAKIVFQQRISVKFLPVTAGAVGEERCDQFH